MALREPQSMDECVYHTIRTIDSGRVRVWVFREKCPKCGKALMSKPKDPKTGKFKIRAKEYTCPECGHTEDMEEYAETLNVNIQYKCPYCNFEGELQIPFRRKKVKIVDEESQKVSSKQALVFQCQKCKKDIIIEKFK